MPSELSNLNEKLGGKKNGGFEAEADSHFSGSKLFQEIGFLEEGDLNSRCVEGNAVFTNDLMFTVTQHRGAGFTSSIRNSGLISYLPMALFPSTSRQELPSLKGAERYGKLLQCSFRIKS